MLLLLLLLLPLNLLAVLVLMSSNAAVQINVYLCRVVSALLPSLIREARVVSIVKPNV